MKLPRDLSGARLIHILCMHYEYRRVHQVGSHIILETDAPVHHRLAVPDHNPLRVGTLGSILRAVASVKGIAKDDILRRLG